MGSRCALEIWLLAIKSLITITFCYREAEMLEIFRRFDRNKDGFITREELQTSLEECRMRQLEIDMDEIMKKADRDGDGKLSYDDFIKGCRFKSKD